VHFNELNEISNEKKNVVACLFVCLFFVFTCLFVGFLFSVFTCLFVCFLFSVFTCLFVGFLLLFGFWFFYICNSILWLNIRLVKRVGKKYMYLQKKAQKTKNTHILRFVYICVCFEIKAWKMSYYVGHLSKVQLSLRQYNVIQCFNATKHNLFPHLYPLLSWYFSMKLPSWNLKPDTVTCNAEAEIKQK
jgi:hypothetical protein